MRHAVRTVALASGASAIVALGLGGLDLRAQQPSPQQAQAPASSPGVSRTEDQNVLQQFDEPCLYRRARLEYNRIVGAQSTPARRISNVNQWESANREKNNPICIIRFDALTNPAGVPQGRAVNPGSATNFDRHPVTDQQFYEALLSNLRNQNSGNMVCSFAEGAYLDTNLVNAIIYGLKLEGACVVPSRAIQAADLQGFQAATMTLSQQLMRILGARDAAPVGGAAPATQSVTQPANPQQSR